MLKPSPTSGGRGLCFSGVGGKEIFQADFLKASKKAFAEDL